MPVRITWLGHASVMIESAVTTYIDPWKLRRSEPKADIVLVTHDHSDHYSEKDIRLISNASTRVVAPMRTAVTTDIISSGGSISIHNIQIQAVPAYNMNKAFHPKENKWIGYILGVEGKKIYHTGDTDRIPEMRDIDVDLAFLPVGGKYTMNSQEAVQASQDMKVGLVIPIHYGDIVGSRKDADEFAGSCKCEVRILQPGGSLDLN